jgi:hypothetical protein
MWSESRVGVEGWCAGLFGNNDGKRADLGLRAAMGRKSGNRKDAGSSAVQRKGLPQ